MKKILAFAISLMLTSNVWAADNAVVVTAGSGLTLRSRDVGAGVQSLQSILGDTSGTALATAPGAANAAFALPIQGVTGGIAVPISGTITVTGVATAANQATEISSLATIATNTGAAIPAGSAIIGKIGIDQTTPGTTNGTAIVGINAATALAGNGTTGTGSLRVTIASDNTAFSVNATGQAGTNRIGYTSDDVCSQKAKTTQAFTTTSAGPVSIVALSGSTVIYICSISAVADTAIKLNFIDGTGGSCASAQHAIWGSTTAANGMSLAANGGFAEGSGNGTVGQTTAASAFCLLQSGTSLVAGNISYVQQ